MIFCCIRSVKERGKRLILRLLSGNKCVDVTRPLLVEIGDNCTILENFLY